MNGTENSVEISGFLQACNFLKTDDSQGVVRLLIYTAHPFAGDSSDAAHAARIPHIALGNVKDLTFSRLSSLADRNLPSENILVPCSVLGRLSEKDGSYHIKFGKDGFRFEDKLAFSENNRVKIVGEVTNIVSGERANYVEFSTGDGLKPFRLDMRMFDSSKVAELSVGDSILVDGVMLNRFVSNGERTVLSSIIAPTRIQKNNISARETRSRKL